MFTLDYFNSFATQVIKLPKTAKYYKSELCVIPDNNNIAQWETIDIFYIVHKGIISKYYFRIVNPIN